MDAVVLLDVAACCEGHCLSDWTKEYSEWTALSVTCAVYYMYLRITGCVLLGSTQLLRLQDNSDS